MGRNQKLTCISCMKREDIKAETSVLWYYRTKEDDQIPIYEYVTGPRELDSPWKGRVKWEGSKDLQDASLRLLNVSLDDAGTYVCEVLRKFEFDYFTPSTTTTRIINLQVKKEASRDLTALYSEIMMYVLVAFLTFWLIVEMVYCYRKISKSDEQTPDTVYS